MVYSKPSFLVSSKSFTQTVLLPNYFYGHIEEYAQVMFSDRIDLRKRMTNRNFSRSTAFAATILVLGVSAGTTAPLRAASFCAAIVESGWAIAVTEAEAKKRAILWWSSRAGAKGPGYENWDRAQRKRTHCEAHKGKTRCKVTAAPCLPEGRLPDLKPGEKHLEL